MPESHRKCVCTRVGTSRDLILVRMFCLKKNFSKSSCYWNHRAEHTESSLDVSAYDCDITALIPSMCIKPKRKI